MTCAIIIEPDTGEKFYAPVGSDTADVPVDVQTQKDVTVWLIVDGEVAGTSTTADEEGMAHFTATLEIGGHSLQARTGTGEDQMDSEGVNICVKAADTRPPLVTGQTLTWYLNWIANTFDPGPPPVPLYSASEAAAIWAGVSLTLTLLAALNAKLGNPPGSWVPINTALNTLAGTTGLSNADAAYEIAAAL